MGQSLPNSLLGLGAADRREQEERSSPERVEGHRVALGGQEQVGESRRKCGLGGQHGQQGLCPGCLGPPGPDGRTGRSRNGGQTQLQTRRSQPYVLSRAGCPRNSCPQPSPKPSASPFAHRCAAFLSSCPLGGFGPEPQARN